MLKDDIKYANRNSSEFYRGVWMFMEPNISNFEQLVKANEYPTTDEQRIAATKCVFAGTLRLQQIKNKKKGQVVENDVKLALRPLFNDLIKILEMENKFEHIVARKKQKIFRINSTSTR